MHHVEQWSRDHGDTSVTNGILLCWYHHDLIHRMNMTITRDTNAWTFTDRHGTPIHAMTEMWRGDPHVPDPDG